MGKTRHALGEYGTSIMRQLITNQIACLQTPNFV
jgi:hypothetical protein